MWYKYYIDDITVFVIRMYKGVCVETILQTVIQTIKDISSWHTYYSDVQQVSILTQNRTEKLIPASRSPDWMSKTLGLRVGRPRVICALAAQQTLEKKPIRDMALLFSDPKCRSMQRYREKPRGKLSIRFGLVWRTTRKQ